MRTFSKQDIANLAMEVLEVEIPAAWTGVDAVLPLLERMRADGAVVLLKWDGERQPAADARPYTAVVQGAPLGDDFYRIDGTSLDEVLCYTIGSYADRVWSNATL